MYNQSRPHKPEGCMYSYMSQLQWRLAKPQLNLRPGWVIEFNRSLDMIIYPCFNPMKTLSVKNPNWYHVLIWFSLIICLLNFHEKMCGFYHLYRWQKTTIRLISWYPTIRTRFCFLPICFTLCYGYLAGPCVMRWHMPFEIALLGTRVVYVDIVPVK